MNRPTITLRGAHTAIDAAVRAAGDIGVSVVVDVVDPGGHRVAMSRMDGAPLLSLDVAADKAWTVISFGQSSRWWADTVREAPDLAVLGKGNRLMPVAGGVPLTIDGQLVGAIGVSGATAEQDQQIAEAGAAALG